MHFLERNVKVESHLNLGDIIDDQGKSDHNHPKLMHPGYRGVKSFLTCFFCGFLVLIYPVTGMAEESSSNGLTFSIGYARFNNLNPDVEVIWRENSIPDVEIGQINFNAISLGLGYHFFSNRTQIGLDLIITSAEELGTVDLPLFEGGYVNGVREKRYYSVIHRLHQQLFNRFYGNIGYGMMIEDHSFSVPHNVIGGGGGSNDIWPSWSWGADIRLTKGIMIGAQVFEVLPKEGHNKPDWRMKNIYVTFLR